MKRTCFNCHRPHTRNARLCLSCVKVKKAHESEAQRQEARLMAKGWLPGFAIIR